MMKNFRMAFLSFVCVFAFSSIAYAGSEMKIKSAYCTDDDVFLYVEGLTEPAEGLVYQIGNVVCEDISYKEIKDAGLPFRTLIMVDNSLSIPVDDREKEKEVIKTLIEGHAEGEQIRLASFSEDIEYLSEYSTDYKALVGVTESIDYHDQETFVTDVLYSELDEIKENCKDGYTRIVIISDGVDNKPIGVTKDELYSKIKESSYPVYTIGTKNGKNNSELENMFALSRMTNADSFILDEIDGVDIVKDIFSKDYDLDVIKVGIPEKAKTGGLQNTKLALPDGSSAEVVINAPFGVEADGKAETEETIEGREEEDSGDNYEGDDEDEEDLIEIKETEFSLRDFLLDHLRIVIIAALSLLVFIIILIIILVSSAKKRKAAQDAKQAISSLKNSPGRTAFENATTELVRENNGEDTSLMFAGERGAKVSYRLTLTDKKDPGKVFECELKDTVIVGRKSDVTDLAVNYDRSISGKHCMIMCKNNRFYIQDLGSANHTKLNGSIIYGEAEVRNGDIITLGRAELYFSAI